MMNTLESGQQSIPKSKPPVWRMVALGVVILMCGMVIGGGLTTYVLWKQVETTIMHPRLMPERIVEHMESSLDLTPEQAEQIQEIFARRHERFDRLRVEMEPLVQAEIDSIREEVARVLTPEQLEEWNRRFDRMHKRWFRGPMFGERKRHGPPPHFGRGGPPDPPPGP
jgi:hypothetical protein